MLLPSVPVRVFRADEFDLYGQPRLRCVGDEKCAVVRFNLRSDNTTLRTDSSASLGHAHEIVADVVLLFPASTQVRIEDIVEVHGQRLRAVLKHPRFTVFGQLDHYQIGCAAWA